MDEPMMQKKLNDLEVVLSANIPHYYHTALALQEANCLKRYIYAVGVRNGDLGLGKLLPKYWQKKLLGHDVSGIEKNRAKSIWWPEVLQKGLPLLGVISQDRGNWLLNHLYDIAAQHWSYPCDIFHFVSSIGLYSARKAKSSGSIIICDSRTACPDHEREVLRDEYELLKIPFHPPGLLYDGKIKKEYELADYFIVPSSYAKRTFLDAGFSNDRVFVLPYGVDLDRFQYTENKTGDGDKDDTFRIIYVGQIIPRKGVHYLIEALGLLDKPDIELLLVGPVSKEMDQYITAAQQRDSRIKLFGHVPWLQLYEYYQKSSVFVLPSLSDSWGLVVTEAMACGSPVIVTENTGSSDAVQEGKNGFVVPIRDSGTLAERILCLYQNPKQRQEMGNVASRIVNHFTWESYSERLLEIYGEILSKETGRE
jgi:glycosyltransferase involved in cell wall biosynthesis